MTELAGWLYKEMDFVYGAFLMTGTCLVPQNDFTLAEGDEVHISIDGIGWLANWVPQCLEAARALQPLWSQPDFKPPRFEDALDRAKNRFSGILSELGLEVPKELNQ